MKKSLNIVAIIPIRGGDSETPETGMVSLGGKPLLSYTIDAAKQSQYVCEVIVSTNDKIIATLARELGAEVPFLRPPELATQDIPLSQVLLHALNWLNSHRSKSIDLVVLLEITHPLRPQGLIDKVIDVVLTEKLDSAFAAREERHEFWTFDKDGTLNRLHPHKEKSRHSLKPLYKEMGGLVTVTHSSVIQNGERLGEKVGVVPVRDCSSLIDLHDPDGLRLAKLLLNT
jgi:N-acylneuraminate cytidylyltransferase/CMP-N,N'-diacetyllegionaminic acid synthase